MRPLRQIPVLKVFAGHAPRSALPDMEISTQRVNLVVALVAFGLPLALIGYAWLSPTTCFMDSISHFYYTQIGGDILVGALVVIAATMMVFYVALPEASADRKPAHSRFNASLVKIAGLCALGVAFVPTTGPGCDFNATTELEVSRFFLTGTDLAPVLAPDGAPVLLPDGSARMGLVGTPSDDFWRAFGGWDETHPLPAWLGRIHFLSAAGMFSILAYMSLVVFRAKQTEAAVDHRVPAEGGGAAMQPEFTPEKRARNRIYLAMGLAILLAMALLTLKSLLAGGMFIGDEAGAAFLETWDRYNGTFWCEALGLWAFGVSWAVKSKLIFRGLNDPGYPAASASRAT